MTKRQTIRRAQQVFGRLEHTEFCVRLFKKDIPEERDEKGKATPNGSTAFASKA